MSNGTLTAKPPGNWTQLNKQLVQAKTLLRQMSRTVEDIEDARIIERAKRDAEREAPPGSRPREPGTAPRQSREGGPGSPSGRGSR